MRPIMVTPLTEIFSPDLRQLAVAAALGRKIDDDRSRRHAVDHLFGHQYRRFLPGNDSRRDDNVALRDDLAQQFALPLIKRFVLRLSVAAGILRVLHFQRKLDEASSETLHLLLDRGPQIVSRNHRSQSSCGSNRLQSGDAYSDDQHASRRDGSGGGSQHRKDTRQGVGGNKHCLVAQRLSPWTIARPCFARAWYAA